MEFKFRQTGQQLPPHTPQSANFECFTEQAAIRVGYANPNLGHGQCEYPPDQQPLPDPYPHTHPHSHMHSNPHAHPHPSMQPHPDHQSHPLIHPRDMHEAIWREIEKEQIREEIIMSEIARRHELEAEVRRELMMERQLASQRGGIDGFASVPSLVMGYSLPMKLSTVGMEGEGRFLEERISSLHEEREKVNEKLKMRGFETMPFQRGNVKPWNSEVKCVYEVNNEKEKIILLAKPDENISGAKRKAAAPPVAGASKVAKKIAKNEWSCALCQVSANSEHALNEHVQGKKHKSKVASLRGQRDGKNSRIDLVPKKIGYSGQVLKTDDMTLGAAESEQQLDKMEEASSKKNGKPQLHVYQNLDTPNKNQPKAVQKGRKSGDGRKYKFWCDICQVGTFSKKVMNAHKKGKKHIRKLQGGNRKVREVPSILKVKDTPEVNNAEWAAEDGKNETVENVEADVDAENSDHEPENAVSLSILKEKNPLDVNSGEGVVEDGKTKTLENGDEDVDAVNADDHVPEDAVKPEDKEAMDSTKLKDNEAIDEVEQEDDEVMTAAEDTGC